MKLVPEGEVILNQDDLGLSRSPVKEDGDTVGRLIVRYESNATWGDFLVTAPSGGLYAGQRRGDGGVRAVVLWAGRLVWTGRYPSRQDAEHCPLIEGILDQYKLVGTRSTGRMRGKLYSKAVAA